MDPPIDTFMTGIRCLQANLCIQFFKALKKVQIVRNIYIYILFFYSAGFIMGRLSIFDDRPSLAKVLGNSLLGCQ